ncbi:hypothetical protein TWF696_001759 [Orbilia brochopaga]|uniref:Uncharacterized protein n=1 Tax=Orbilia brochopaga TaxID=3140254 RepID=A0AAV9U6G7_9PEZI
MQFTAAALLLIAQFSGALAASTVAAECGSLGVLNTDNLPAGVDPSAVRKCDGHPLGRDRAVNTALLTPATAEELQAAQNGGALDARSVVKALSGRATNACWFGASSGCTKGYCWRNCGPNGQWCWTATNSGYGDWIQCRDAGSCADSNAACGQGCKPDNKACGCSC